MAARQDSNMAPAVATRHLAVLEVSLVVSWAADR
jgi:hypothetical protein